MSKIISVIPNHDHTLLIELSNHHKIILDMKPRLQAIRFCELAEMEIFKNVKLVNNDTLVWNDQCQITMDEMLSLIKR